MASWTATVTASSEFAAQRTQIYTNFGPLTTPFVAPASCRFADPAQEGLVEFSITSGSTTIVNYDCGQANAYYIQQPGCYPSSSGMGVLQTATATALYAGYFSPGLVCPSGWVTGSSWTYQPGATDGVIIRSLIGNTNMAATIAKCCPSAYTLGDSGYCVYGVTTATSGAMCGLDFACKNNSTSGTYICPTSPSPFTWSPDQTDTQISASAYPLEMVYQPSDMSLIPSSTSSTTAGGITTTSGSRTGGTTTSSSVHQDHGTPTKVLVPAIVVPVVALIAIIAGIFFLLRARKRRARERAYATGTARIAPFGHEKNTTTSRIVSSDGGEVQQYYQNDAGRSY